MSRPSSCAITAWVIAAQRGETKAFESLIRHYQDAVCALLYSWRLEPALVEDVAQSVFMTAWERLDTLEQPAAFGGWLRTIARNKASDAWKRAQRGPPDLARPLTITPPDPVELTDLRRVVAELLEGLTEEQQSLFWLTYWQERTATEVGAELGLSAAAVRKRLSRARQELKHRHAQTLRALRPTAGFTAMVALGLPSKASASGLRRLGPRAAMVATGLAAVAWLASPASSPPQPSPARTAVSATDTPHAPTTLRPDAPTPPAVEAPYTPKTPFPVPAGVEVVDMLVIAMRPDRVTIRHLPQTEFGNFLEVPAGLEALVPLVTHDVHVTSIDHHEELHRLREELGLDTLSGHTDPWKAVWALELARHELCDFEIDPYSGPFGFAVPRSTRPTVLEWFAFDRAADRLARHPDPDIAEAALLIDALTQPSFDFWGTRALDTLTLLNLTQKARRPALRAAASKYLFRRHLPASLRNGTLLEAVQELPGQHRVEALAQLAELAEQDGDLETLASLQQPLAEAVADTCVVATRACSVNRMTEVSVEASLAQRTGREPRGWQAQLWITLNSCTERAVDFPDVSVGQLSWDGSAWTTTRWLNRSPVTDCVDQATAWTPGPAQQVEVFVSLSGMSRMDWREGQRPN